MSFWRVYYHLVWATKERQPFITSAIETRLFPYLAGKAVEQDIIVYALNGWTDHTHLVASIPPKLAIAEAVKRLKGASSHFINHVIRPGYDFAWQRGYGVFSLSQSQLAQATSYVEKQKIHHAQQTTNAWLERTAECDEGPPLTSCNPDEPLTKLKEPAITYHALGETPF
jgi:putative transposase